MRCIPAKPGGRVSPPAVSPSTPPISSLWSAAVCEGHGNCSKKGQLRMPRDGRVIPTFYIWDPLPRCTNIVSYCLLGRHNVSSKDAQTGGLSCRDCRLCYQIGFDDYRATCSCF